MKPKEVTELEESKLCNIRYNSNYLVLLIENGRCSYNLARLIKEQAWKYD